MNKYPKIIATIGPTSQSYQEIKSLVISGVDIFRLNFSHGTHTDYFVATKLIRTVSDELRSNTKILVDLQGPKLRIGCFRNHSETLKPGKIFTLDLDETLGSEKRVLFPHHEIYEVLVPGTQIFINDGLIHLEVIERNDVKIVTKVIHGGQISNHKGINITGIDLPLSCCTPKDMKDIAILPQLNPDFIAISFVRSASDIISFRERLRGVKIISKIETYQGIQNIEEILEVSDGIMIARGDLGIETSLCDLPRLQEYLILKAHHQNKMVIVATQMLKSMVNAPIPTRAEANDAYIAYKQGAYALMLSDETANGFFAQEAVSFLSRLIDTQNKAEGEMLIKKKIDNKLKKR